MSEVCDQICDRLEKMRSKTRLGHDIEGYCSLGITDFSFADASRSALWIPLKTGDGASWWSPADEHRIIAATRLILEDPGIVKVMHNGLYEMFAWRWCHGIVIRGVADTMLAWHELAAEMDKALEVPASILTRRAYWKFGRSAINDVERAQYNCIDSAITLELDGLIAPLLEPGQRKHYEFNLALLEPLSEMMFHGIRFDLAARDELVARIQQEVFALQGRLDKLAGIRRPELAEVIEKVCVARKAGYVEKWEDVSANAKPTWKGEI